MTVKFKALVITNMLMGANHRVPYQGVYVSEQINSLHDVGVDVSVILVRGFKGKLRYIFSIFYVVYVLYRCRPKVVHFHYGLTGWMAPLLRILPLIKPKIVLTLHGSDVQAGGVSALISKVSCKGADVVVVQSQRMAEIVRGVARQVVILPCGVDTRMFVPRVGGKVGRAGRLVVFPGDPQRPVKNYPLFERVIERARSAGFKVETACVVGLSREEVASLLQEADCLLMTSHSEGSPQIVKESLACGLPVVSVPVGDVSTLVDGVDQCFVVDGHCERQLSEALITCLSTASRSHGGPARIERLGLSGRSVASGLAAIYATQK